MPNYAVQRRRGTTAEHSSFTGLAGELTVDTTKDTVVVHDGSTAGGIPLATEAYANTAVSAADLDLTTDSGTIDIDLDSETLTVAGGAGITTSATSTTATVAMDYSAVWNGNLVPNADNTRDLGSASVAWRSLYVGPGSLYLNGQKVLDDDSGNIVISCDANQNLVLNTSGTGDVEFQATGSGTVQCKSTFQIQTTKRITDSAGTKIEFGDAIDLTTNKLINVGTPASATDGATKGYVDTIAGITPAGGTLTTTGDLTVTGDLLVSGDTVTVNVATLAIEDAMVELASGNTGGATSYIGMKAERGSAGNDAYMVWEESSDKWRATTSADGVTHADANMQCGTLTGTATAAQYSDLAERYETDQMYTAGTVVCFGGNAEITQSTDLYDSKVAGVISTNPAHLMNAQAGTNETHPAVALTGRVPCKVMGTIRKGDLMVTSAMPGVAMSADERVPGTIIGKAIQDYTDGGIGVIEILVTLM